MSETRQHAHELIDRLPETQISATLQNAPFDDEPETDAERLAVAQARTSLKKNGGKGVPHNEAMRRRENGR
jgi:hypothetical protein